MKVAVFGASGFVGATAVEHLLARNVETQMFIHSFGNAWRLARAAIPMRTIDVTSAGELSQALADCTHVVNCTRGSSEVMLAGLKNLLVASKANGVRRFVHLSSVAVYGDPPPPASEREEAPTQSAPGTYGGDKLRQDDMVAEAVAGGLDCVVLCPPNISGVYSSFVSNVLSDMRNGSFALLDGGARPLATVDVDNLAHAIILALQVARGDGKRIFVTDGGEVTWKELTDALMPLAELRLPLPSIGAGELPVAAAVRPPSSLWKSLKHLVSSDVREALRRDPLWAKLDKRMRRLATLGGKGVEERLKQSIEGPIKIAKVADANPYASRYNAMQLRNVRHRIDRARDLLGYDPPLDFAASMARFRLWYETMHGFGEPYWPLARIMNGFSA